MLLNRYKVTTSQLPASLFQHSTIYMYKYTNPNVSETSSYLETDQQPLNIHHSLPYPVMSSDKQLERSKMYTVTVCVKISAQGPDFALQLDPIIKRRIEDAIDVAHN